MNPSTAELTIYNLSDAPLHLHVHLGAALLAVLVGVLILLRRKGTNSHRALGWCWVVLMLTVSLTSFFIQARGRFSLIHVLSVVVLIAIPIAVVAARKGNVRLHKMCMISTFSGLVIAGFFTLLPYRMLGRIAFG